MNRSLNGRVAIVTGAGRGIGRAIVEAMSAEGANVAANAITKRSLVALEERLDQLHRRKKLLPLLGDASDPAFAEKALSDVIKQFGRVDILVNNVGIGFPKPTIELDLEEWDRIMDVNLRSAFIWSRLVGREILEAGRQGTIINVASNLAVIGRGERAAYIASKAGLLGLTRALAAEWGPIGIRVNAIAPGTTKTDRVAEILGAGRSSESDYLKRIPLKRLGTPKEIADVVVFLASDSANYINGETILVDGGTAVTH